MRKILIIILTCLIFLSADPAQAVSLYLKIDKNNSAENISVLSIDTGTDIINAIEGKISYDQNALDCNSSVGAKSIINLWLSAPTAKNGEIAFSGIIPGGYVGQGEITSIFCQAKNGGEISDLALNNDDFQIYLSDGTGNLAPISIIGNKLVDSIEHQAILDANLNDKSAPEILGLQISKNTELTGNNYLLIFNAVDKQSGIASVAMSASDKKFNIEQDFEKMKTDLPWTEIQSPYALPNDALNKFIYLKTADSAGNIRLSRLDPIKQWWEIDLQSIFLIATIAISLAVILLIVVKLKRRK